MQAIRHKLTEVDERLSVGEDKLRKIEVVQAGHTAKIDQLRQIALQEEINRSKVTLHITPAGQQSPFAFHECIKTAQATLSRILTDVQVVTEPTRLIVTASSQTRRNELRSALIGGLNGEKLQVRDMAPPISAQMVQLTKSVYGQVTKAVKEAAGQVPVIFTQEPRHAKDLACCMIANPSWHAKHNSNTEEQMFFAAKVEQLANGEEVIKAVVAHALEWKGKKLPLDSVISTLKGRHEEQNKGLYQITIDAASPKDIEAKKGKGKGKGKNKG